MSVGLRLDMRLTLRRRDKLGALAEVINQMEGI